MVVSRLTLQLLHLLSQVPHDEALQDLGTRMQHLKQMNVQPENLPQHKIKISYVVVSYLVNQNHNILLYHHHLHHTTSLS